MAIRVDSDYYTCVVTFWYMGEWISIEYMNNAHAWMVNRLLVVKAITDLPLTRATFAHRQLKVWNPLNSNLQVLRGQQPHFVKVMYFNKTVPSKLIYLKCAKKWVLSLICRTFKYRTELGFVFCFKNKNSFSQHLLKVPLVGILPYVH